MRDPAKVSCSRPFMWRMKMARDDEEQWNGRDNDEQAFIGVKQWQWWEDKEIGEKDRENQDEKK